MFLTWWQQLLCWLCWHTRMPAHVSWLLMLQLLVWSVWWTTTHIAQTCPVCKCSCSCSFTISFIFASISYLISFSPLLLYSCDSKDNVPPGSTKFEQRQVAQFNDHKSTVWRLCWNITGTTLASTGDDGCIRLWRCEYWLEGLSRYHLYVYLQDGGSPHFKFSGQEQRWWQCVQF